MSWKPLRQKIKQKTARIGVMGLGYVGLPLALAFTKNGFTVTGVDIDAKKVARLNRGLSYVPDVRPEEIREAARKKIFKATTEDKSLAGLDVVIICVPTPLSKTKEPDIEFVVAAARSIARHLRRGQLIVLESTTYPGTTEEVILPILQKSGLAAEKDFFLAFSPERVDPGNKEFDTVSIPKVVGGVGKLSTQAARLLYGQVIRRVVEVSSAKTAEMVKLLENTFRSVNIGLINEVAVMSNRMGIDIWEVIEAAKTKPFGFMPFYPGPGLGGHCLPIDPLYLSWKSRLHGFEAKMIELASLINESMPLYVVERITHLLNERRIPLKNAPILALGVTYKRGSDDIRESPALDVITHLLEQGSRVSYSDPFVPSLKVTRRSLKSVPISPSVLKKQACAVVLTDHEAFDYGQIARYSKLVLDTRNAMRKYSPRQNLFFL